MTTRKQKADWKALRDSAEALERLASLRGWSFAWELTPNMNGEREMGHEFQIELREGETASDALLRIAKERTGKDFTKPEPAQSQARRVKQVEKVVADRNSALPKPSASKSSGRPVGELGGDPNSGQSEEPEVFAALHIYQREGETIEKMRYNARREREMHGPGTLIFAHAHVFGAACDNQCRVRVIETNS